MIIDHVFHFSFPCFYLFLSLLLISFFFSCLSFLFRISFEKFGNLVERFSRTSLFFTFRFFENFGHVWKKRKEIKFTKKVATTDNIEKQWKKGAKVSKRKKKRETNSEKREKQQKGTKTKPSTKQIGNFFWKDSKQSVVLENFTTESPNFSKTNRNFGLIMTRLVTLWWSFPKLYF